ncbi:MAG TPA: TraB/GumN family protein [Pseudoflavonifractor sp.]|nr:TraB/GumN family protein [Pseudoflavonifractor sp.]
MKKHKLLSLLLALALAAGLAAPAFAAEETEFQLPSPWAVESLADAYALGLVDDDYGSYIQSSLTEDALTALAAVAADKLALLGLEVNASPAVELVVDTTRGGVINALYQEAAAYALPGIERAPADYLVELGVVKGGTNSDLMLERQCSYQEAMVMTQRLILALYDQAGAGSKGLLWKATNGDNTLYLLGTIHMDRGNVYPFHKSLRDAIAAAQEVIFEVDLNDVEGMTEFAAMQTYSDGTGLKDHVSAELYADAVSVFAQLGMTEEQVNAYKPWVLLLTLNSLLTADESTGSNAMAVDMYVNAVAVNAGKEIGAVETMAFQGAIFDDLSLDYQTEGLAAYLAMIKAGPSDEPTDEEQQAIQDALAAQSQIYDDMMAAWKNSDVDAMAALLDKAAILASDDEMSARLFADRDPNMIKAAAAYLETPGENTFFLAVGAGHMLDPGGIVGGLRELGYTVELVK